MILTDCGVLVDYRGYDGKAVRIHFHFSPSGKILHTSCGPRNLARPRSSFGDAEAGLRYTNEPRSFAREDFTMKDYQASWKSPREAAECALIRTSQRTGQSGKCSTGWLSI